MEPVTRELLSEYEGEPLTLLWHGPRLDGILTILGTPIADPKCTIPYRKVIYIFNSVDDTISQTGEATLEANDVAISKFLKQLDTAYIEAVQDYKDREARNGTLFN